MNCGDAKYDKIWYSEDMLLRLFLWKMWTYFVKGPCMVVATEIRRTIGLSLVRAKADHLALKRPRIIWINFR